MDAANVVRNATFSLNQSESSSNSTVDYFGTLETTIFGFWFIIIIVCSVIGNIFVILVILLDKDLRHVKNGTNLFLFNLALSDIMVGIFLAPVSLYTITHEHWNLNKSILCSLDSFLNVAFVITSVHILMYISIHKYLSVKRLSECDRLPVSKIKCYIMIGASWIWGAIFASLTTFILSKAEYKPKTTQCGPRYPVFSVKNFSLSLGNFIINFLIPFVIMVVMYLKIYYIMKKSADFHRETTSGDTTTHHGDKAAINTLIIVLSCYIICWIPYNVYVCYTNVVFFDNAHAERDLIPAFLNPLVYCCGFTNSACNPIIYAFRFPDFRNGYLHILKRISCRKVKEKGSASNDHSNDRKEGFRLVPHVNEAENIQ